MGAGASSHQSLEQAVLTELQQNMQPEVRAELAEQSRLAAETSGDANALQNMVSTEYVGSYVRELPGWDDSEEVLMWDGAAYTVADVSALVKSVLSVVVGAVELAGESTDCGSGAGGAAAADAKEEGKAGDELSARAKP